MLRRAKPAIIAPYRCRAAEATRRKKKPGPKAGKSHNEEEQDPAQQGGVRRLRLVQSRRGWAPTPKGEGRRPARSGGGRACLDRLATICTDVANWQSGGCIGDDLARHVIRDRPLLQVDGRTNLVRAQAERRTKRKGAICRNRLALQPVVQCLGRYADAPRRPCSATGSPYCIAESVHVRNSTRNVFLHQRTVY